MAAVDAIEQSGIDFSKEETYRCGVLLGSGIGGLTEMENQVERLLTKGPDRVSAFTIPKLMVNAAGGHISIRYGIRGPNYTVATACASATNAIGDAFKTIDMLRSAGHRAQGDHHRSDGQHDASSRGPGRACTIRRPPEL